MNTYEQLRLCPHGDFTDTCLNVECTGSDQTMARLERHHDDRRPYVYVASSWRCDMHPAVVAALRAAGIGHYDFRNPAGRTGFSWKDVGGSPLGPENERESVNRYLEMLEHPAAIVGFESDLAAMRRADTFVLVLPCGRSAHLELGWAVGQGKRTAILLEDPTVPELMYRMVDYLATSLVDLLGWLGVED